MAKRRVLKRVQEGGHNIPPEVIERRYYRGIENLQNLYIPICTNWMIVSNTTPSSREVALGSETGQTELKTLSDKIMQGLIISDGKGNIQEVSAKKYLRTMK
jgi:predicted ABC-type ATPase